MKQSIITFLFIFIGLNTNSQEVTASRGSVERFTDFKSEYVASRNIDVWLPDGYLPNGKYAVLYMHDGQMLYDASTTWNKQAWEVDEVANTLIVEEKTQKFIVVGIWNNGEKRHSEYFPQKPYESLTQIQRDTLSTQLQKAGRSKGEFIPFSDLYLKFIVTELKPFIDKEFSTKTDAAHTFIAGSSMGGLISMYAICEYPEVFGGGACISTHWPGTMQSENNPIPDAFIKYLKVHLPSQENHKIYFDCGDQTLDSTYKPLQDKVDLVMKEKGFNSRNWMTRFFPGKEHSENAWHERLDIPLEFLLKK